MKAGTPKTGKSSPWAFMERFEIPSFDDPDRLYLTRYRVIQTPFASIYLHRMDSPDSRPTLHDHPWSFVSIILRGGYWEQRLDLHTRQMRRRKVRHVNVMRRDDAHYIESLFRAPTWTLLFVGKRRRTWGYWRHADDWTDLQRGAWSWTPFDRDIHADEFAEALQARAQR